MTDGKERALCLQRAPRALPGLIVGGFCVLLRVLCFVFNSRLGGWLRRFPVAAFGAREKVALDETAFHGLACLAGLLCVGRGSRCRRGR
jgi:hypothetical protein